MKYDVSITIYLSGIRLLLALLINSYDFSYTKSPITIYYPHEIVFYVLKVESFTKVVVFC